MVAHYLDDAAELVKSGPANRGFYERAWKMDRTSGWQDGPSFTLQSFERRLVEINAVIESGSLGLKGVGPTRISFNGSRADTNDHSSDWSADKGSGRFVFMDEYPADFMGNKTPQHLQIRLAPTGREGNTWSWTGMWWLRTVHRTLQGCISIWRGDASYCELQMISYGWPNSQGTFRWQVFSVMDPRH